VQALTPSIAALFRLPTRHGLLVGSICSKSTAASAGLHGAKQQVTVAGVTWPIGGDVIVKLDGTPVASVDAFRTLIANRKPGQTVTLEIYRAAKEMTLQAKLGRQPLSSRC